MTFISIWKPNYCNMKSEPAFMSLIIFLVSLDQVLTLEKLHEYSQDGKNFFNITVFFSHIWIRSWHQIIDIQIYGMVSGHHIDVQYW